MTRRFVDLSVPLQAGIASDPPGHLPEIDYYDHRQTAAEVVSFFPGASVDDLPVNVCVHQARQHRVARVSGDGLGGDPVPESAMSPPETSIQDRSLRNPEAGSRRWASRISRASVVDIYPHRHPRFPGRFVRGDHPLNSGELGFQRRGRSRRRTTRCHRFG